MMEVVKLIKALAAQRARNPLCWNIFQFITVTLDALKVTGVTSY